MLLNFKSEVDKPQNEAVSSDKHVKNNSGNSGSGASNIESVKSNVDADSTVNTVNRTTDNDKNEDNNDENDRNDDVDYDDDKIHSKCDDAKRSSSLFESNETLLNIRIDLCVCYR